MFKLIGKCFLVGVNLFCCSSGIACFYYVCTQTYVEGMDYVIGGIGLLSITYSINELVKLIKVK